MKKLLILFLCVCALQTEAQRFLTDFPRETMKEFFNNVNGELCIELYRKRDALSEYRVFLVLEDLEESDIQILQQWNTLGSTTKTAITQRWSMLGKRVEVERSPYLSYAPVFPTEKKEPILVPLKKTFNSQNVWYPDKSPLEP
jgi:hypothetical protein